MSVTGGEPSGDVARRPPTGPATHWSRTAIGVVGAGAMGSGIAQAAARAGHPVYLVDSIPGAADAAIQRSGSTLDRLAAKGIITAEEAAATSPGCAVASVPDLPQCALTLRRFARISTTSERCSAAHAHPTREHDPRDQHVQPRRQRHRRRPADPGRIIGLHFFNPGTYAARRGGSRPVSARRPGDLPRDSSRLGQDPRALRIDAGVHRQPGRPTLLRRGPADARGGHRRSGDHRRWACGPRGSRWARWSSPTHRPGRQPRGRRLVWERTGRDPRYAPTAYQRELLEAGGSGASPGAGCSATRAARRSTPSPTRPPRPGWSAGRSAPTRWPARWRCSSTRRSTSSRAAGHRERHRHRDAARHELSARTHRMGSPDRSRSSRRATGRTRLRLPGGPLSPEPRSAGPA